MQIQSYIHGRRLDLILSGKMDALAIAEVEQTVEAAVSPAVCVAVAHAYLGLPSQTPPIT